MFPARNVWDRYFRSTTALLVALGVTPPAFTFAQNYPNKPIRLIASEAGGGGDMAARLIGTGLTKALGQQVVVDNRGGGGNVVGPLLARSSPNGYTLLLFGSTLWITPLLHSESLYDPLKDFSFVALTSRSPNVLVVHPSLPIKSVQELIAYAKSKPGNLNYGSGAAGASTHLAGELFKEMAHVDIVRVPYKGSGPAMNAVMSGAIQVMFSTTGAAVAQVKAGRLRALAVTSADPSPLAPGLPTVAASGVPGYESVSKDGIFAAAHTPAAIINRLNQLISQVVNESDIRARFLNAGVEAVGSSPQVLEAAVKSDIATISKLIKDTGMRAD